MLKAMSPKQLKAELDRILGKQRKSLILDQEIIQHATITQDWEGVLKRRARGDERFVALVSCLSQVVTFVDEFLVGLSGQIDTDKKLQDLQSAYAALAARSVSKKKTPEVGELKAIIEKQRQTIQYLYKRNASLKLQLDYRGYVKMRDIGAV